MKHQKTPVKAIQDVTARVESKELKVIIRFILSRVRTEKIICFGSIINDIKTTSCFLPEAHKSQSKQNSYYLLIVPTAHEQTADILLQQRLEEALKTVASVTILVHRMKEINTALQNDSSFFSSIYKKGTLLYDNEAEPFAVPIARTGISERIARREKFWGQWYLLSQNFLKGANFYYERQFNNLAVFMLHQSLQHCYSGMLRVLIGYRSNSNSLKRLLKLVDNVLPESSFSATKHTPENARLSGLLMKGFSDARYNDKFEVTNDELTTMISRIEKILKQANITCLAHLKNLKEGKTPYTIA